MYFALTPPLPVLSRCVLSCPGCSACASGSVWLPFSCVRPLSTTPSNSIMGRGPDEPPSTWSVSPSERLSGCYRALKSIKIRSFSLSVIFFSIAAIAPWVLFCHCSILGVVAHVFNYIVTSLERITLWVYISSLIFFLWSRYFHWYIIG